MARQVDDHSTTSRPRRPSTYRYQYWLVPIIVVTLILVGLLMPIPEMGSWLRSATDILHGPLFATLAVILLAILNRFGIRLSWTVGISVWLSLSVLGGLIEVAQLLVDRHATLKDGIANASGAAAGVIWMAAWQRASSQEEVGRSAFVSWLLSILGLVLMIVGSLQSLMQFANVTLQLLQMPLLASFESEAEIRRWKRQDCQATRTRKFATEGDWAMDLKLQPGPYPGLTLEPPSNWLGYSDFVFDVYLTGEEPLDLIVKIYDQEHDKSHHDRFHYRASLRPGHNEVRIWLGDVASAPRYRKMDLTKIKTLQLFCAGLKQERRIFLDHVRLEN